MAMRYDNWLARLRNIAGGLASQNIDIQIEIGDPTPEDEIEREEAYFAQTTGRPGFRFHESLRRLYLEARRITFRWQTRSLPNVRPMFGGMQLAPLAMLYESESGVDTEEPWHGVWRVLDESGAVTQVVVRFDKRDGAASLAWRSTEGDLESITLLELTIDEYFEFSLAACCLSNWPLLFASDWKILTQEHVEEFYAALEDITPPGDADAIRRRREGI
jgi:hypothetical protein